MQRMHNPEREAKKADRIHRTKALKQKEPTTDFESFMFKCRLCMMGFRRRGMLVVTFVYLKFVYYLFFCFVCFLKLVFLKSLATCDLFLTVLSTGESPF